MIVVHGSAVRQPSTSLGESASEYTHIGALLGSMHALRNVCSLDPSLMHLRTASRAILFCALHICPGKRDPDHRRRGWVERVVAGSGWWVGCCIATPNQPSPTPRHEANFSFPGSGCSRALLPFCTKTMKGNWQ